jgi:hypothetical protein
MLGIIAAVLMAGCWGSSHFTHLPVYSTLCSSSALFSLFCIS